MKKLEELLVDHPVFKGLEPEYIRVIAGCASNVVFQAGEQIFKEGDDANYFYVIRRGKVALEVFAPRRGPIYVLSVEDGDVVGWSWLFPPYKWHFDARAMELTRAAAFDAKCLRDKFESDPKLGYELMKRFAHVMLDRVNVSRLQLLDMYGKDFPQSK
jgi:CRP/FNR family cyclic AMP-dependent transcriptional regulator